MVPVKREELEVPASIGQQNRDRELPMLLLDESVARQGDLKIHYCPGGEMADTLVLEASAIRRTGTSPLPGTTPKSEHPISDVPLSSIS